MPTSNPYLPAFHFVPRRGWMNDPNGLVFFGGRWHLFYQYYNLEEVDGMQWGHASSVDLVGWEHHLPALRPDRLGQIWSGSAVVDKGDSSGFFGGGSGLVCAFTYWDPLDHWQSQGIAWSRDGVEFVPYAGNPVIAQLRHLEGQEAEKDFRDPKVFWHAETARWVMVVAGGRLRTFSSHNLIDWRFGHLHPEISTECPDLFPMAVGGDPANQRWVLTGGGRWYQVGSFDGVRFTPEADRQVMGAGPDFYATQSWSEAPGGRRVLISWLFGWGYGVSVSGDPPPNPFPTGLQRGGCLTVPMEAELVETPRGLRLRMNPVAELESRRRFVFEGSLTLGGRPAVLGEGVSAYDLTLEAAEVPDHPVQVAIPAGGPTRYLVEFDPVRSLAAIDRRQGACPEVPNYPIRHVVGTVPSRPGQPWRVRLLVDRGSVEVFADGGETVLSAVIHPEPGVGGCSLSAEGAVRVEAKLFALGSGAASL